MIISFFEDIFKCEKFPVEYFCFQQLKDLDIDYVAIPWTQILNSHWLDYPNRQSKDYYFRELSKYRIQQDNNFTVCQHDSYMLLAEYYKHLKITKVFTPLHDSRNTLEGIEFIPIAFTNSFNFNDVEKTILFSFVGAITTHPIRQQMVERINGTGIIYRNEYHVSSNIYTIKIKEEEEYRDILNKSKFSLCPRGSSPSSVRFWESLAAGAIPILISDNWVLPDWDWDNTILKISEREFDTMTYRDIENYLKIIPQERYNILKQNCKAAYQKFNQDKFKDYILSNI